MATSVNQSLKPITTVINSNGNLEIGGCDLVDLATKFNTPLYVLDEKSIRKMCTDYKNAFSGYKNTKFQYALKALCCTALASILSQEGFGFDAVSAGEIITLKNANVDFKTVLFNGNNKSPEELDLAVNLGVEHISVDNFSELALLNEIAKSYGKKVNILLRVTPGIECHTHEYIQTGHLDSKFGFDLTQIDDVIELIKNEYTMLNLQGLHAHIGSQIFETKIYGDEINLLIDECVRIKNQHGLILTHINVGGGLGVKYTEKDAPPSVNNIANVILTALTNKIKEYNIEPPTLCLEPGRSIISTAGVTLYTVGSYKQVPNGRKYVALDGGMADNLRPAMYQAQYSAQVVNKPESKNLEKVTLAGRFCESGDILIKDIDLPQLEEGDIVCIYNTGAYNYSMSSNYNRVVKPAIALVNDSVSDLIVRRESLEDLLSHDIIPDRLKNVR